MDKKRNPLLEMLKQHGYNPLPYYCPSILITEPITEENFKEFQEKLRSLVPPDKLEALLNGDWDLEKEE